MKSVLHVLPHAGGGGETYLDLLAELDGFEQERRYLSSTRSAALALPSIAMNRRALSRRAREVDIVDVHGDMASMICLPVLRHAHSVITTHGLSFLRRASGPALAVGRRRFTAAARAADRIVCTSPAERAELAALLPESLHPRLAVIPPAIRMPSLVDAGERSQAREALGLGDDDVVALCLGRLDEWKDPLTAALAAVKARAAGSNLVLLLAGDGPLMNDISAMGGAAVRVLGYSDDPGRLIAASDLFVLPSRREGTSMALLEAMGRGLVAVVSDGLGNPDVVGDAGVVFPVGDADALGRELARLATDPAECERLGAAARARVAEEYEADRFLQRMHALFDEIAITRE